MRGGGSGSIHVSIEPLVKAAQTSPQLHSSLLPKQVRRGLLQTALRNPGKPRKTDVGREQGLGTSHGSHAGPGIGTGSGQEGMDTVLATIRSRIERAKRYPSLARRRGQEGQALVSFAIMPDGHVGNLTLLHSSGSSLIDEEALATIQRATPFPFYPEPIQIGIRFEIRD